MYCTKTALHVGKESGTSHESSHGDGSGGHGTSVVTSSAAGGSTGTAGDLTSLLGGLGDLGLDSLAGGTSGRGEVGAERGDLLVDGAGGTGKSAGHASESAGVDRLGAGRGALGLCGVGSGLGGSGSISHRSGNAGLGSGVDARSDLAANTGGDILDDGRSIVNNGGSVLNARGNITNDGGDLTSTGDGEGLGLWCVSKKPFITTKTRDRT